LVGSVRCVLSTEGMMPFSMKLERVEAARVLATHGVMGEDELVELLDRTQGTRSLFVSPTVARINSTTFGGEDMLSLRRENYERMGVTL